MGEIIVAKDELISKSYDISDEILSGNIVMYKCGYDIEDLPLNSSILPYMYNVCENELDKKHKLYLVQDKSDARETFCRLWIEVIAITDELEVKLRSGIDDKKSRVFKLRAIEIDNKAVSKDFFEHVLCSLIALNEIKPTDRLWFSHYFLMLESPGIWGYHTIDFLSNWLVEKCSEISETSDHIGLSDDPLVYYL